MTNQQVISGLGHLVLQQKQAQHLFSTKLLLDSKFCNVFSCDHFVEETAADQQILHPVTAKVIMSFWGVINSYKVQSFSPKCLCILSIGHVSGTFIV